MEQTEFGEQLKARVLDSISRGRTHLVLWGFNPNCIRLVADLHALGLGHCVMGILDSNSRNHGGQCFGHRISPPDGMHCIQMDALVIVEDSKKEEALRTVANLDKRLPEVILAGKGHFEFQDELFEQLVAACPVKSKAGGYPFMLMHIYQSIRHLAARGIRGSLAEFGAFQCGTTVFIAKLLQALGVSSKIYAFDTFSGYPPRRSILDLFSSPKCEFRDISIVESYCREFSIELVRGDISDTYSRLKGIPLMFTFFDTDNYSPTKASLELCYEQTVEGGILAFDHYFSPDWLDTIGERLAAKEILSQKQLFHLHGTGIFLKI
jgi:O-methyltransferase